MAWIFGIIYQNFLKDLSKSRAVAYDATHFAPKKWLTKSCNLCWKGIGQTPTFGVILKTNEKYIKNWNELFLVGSLRTNKFNQKQFA